MVGTSPWRIILLLAALGAAKCPADPAAADVESILERIEDRGAGVNDLRCRVIYMVEDRIADDKVIREGEILYKKKEPNPVFMITFTKTIQEGTVSRLKSWWLFDGRWLYEAKQRSKSIIKRDLAPSGERIDLFDLEKAPFPIPFGQKKDKILANFDVRLGPGGANAPPDTDHLICTPKPEGRFAKDYTKVEFFVDRSLNLPTKIVMTENPPDKVITATFPDLSNGSLNTNLADSIFRLPRETKRYAVETE